MSRENVEIVGRAWEHFFATGEPLEGATAADFVWDMSTFRDVIGLQKEYLGADGMRQFLREWTEPFDSWRIDVEDVIDAGDQVITVCTQHGIAKASGLQVDMRLAMVFTVRDGRQTRMEMYADPAEALEALGLKQ